MVMKKGSTIKPTAKSETARPRRSKIEGYRKEGVFYTTVIIKVFVKIDTIIKMMFTMEFRTMKSHGTFSFSDAV